MKIINSKPKLKKLVILIFFIATSCQFFKDNSPSEKELLKKRMNEINWKTVDVFPTISVCSQLKDESQRKQCFFDFIEQTITNKLKRNYKKTDTVLVKVCISENGKLELETDKSPVLDSIIKTSLLGFPRISPAIKQGIFVKTQFDLKIIY